MMKKISVAELKDLKKACGNKFAMQEPFRLQLFDTSIRTEGVWIEVDEDDDIENGATLRILPSGGRESVM